MVPAADRTVFRDNLRTVYNTFLYYLQSVYRRHFKSTFIFVHSKEIRFLFVYILVREISKYIAVNVLFARDWNLSADSNQRRYSMVERTIILVLLSFFIFPYFFQEPREQRTLPAAFFESKQERRRQTRNRSHGRFQNSPPINIRSG